jgi:exodeoxyribonuclease V gamma subunit
MATIMPVDGQPDFRLYHSNALDVLAGILAEVLRQPLPDVSPLQPETVLIPQVAMRRWLQATLAQQHGIVANIEFLTPGEFVGRVLDANVPGGDDDLDTPALHWRLYAALRDRALLARPAMAQIAAYLSASATDAGDALKGWTLAGELASVFEKYQAWRRDWLLRWEDGADPDDPQAILWRVIAASHSYRARRIQHYLDRFGADDRPLPQGLPARLFAFATLNVSPDVLRIIASQARVGTTHFFMPTPSRNDWGDMEVLRQRLREGEADPLADSAGDNRLLRAWGAAGRDFVALLGSYEVVHPRGEVSAFVDPDRRSGRTLAGDGLSDSLLHRLQGDLFHRRPPPPAVAGADDPRTPLPGVRWNDPSLQFHACHTRLRELQVLHDQLRALFEDKRFDPPLQPREVAVLAPDIDLYVPYLDAVFGAGAESARIPYAVADTSPLAGETLADVFVQLLGLPVSRFGLGEILDLVASAPIADAAGLDLPAIERLRGWLQEAGARWGLDARHREAHEAPADSSCTWQFALDRLILGHATGIDADIKAGDGLVAPLPLLEGSALDGLDTLVSLLRRLVRFQNRMGQAQTPAQWRELLLGMLDDLLPVPPGDDAGQRALKRLRTLVDDFARDAERAGFDEAVSCDIVSHHFASRLSDADTRAPLLTGGVSFARMVPMRLLPFRVICVLGLNDGDYPRRDPAFGLNRLTAVRGSPAWRPGDRSLRDDDRFLFLQLFAAAQDVFYVSYLGADPHDASTREPSALVSELLDEAARQHADAPAAAKALVVRHPLQPFAPAAFGAEGEPRRFSYRGHWHPAAAALAGHARSPLPPWFSGAPLPIEDTPVRVSLDQLRRFLMSPAQAFIEQRLGLRLPEIDEGVEDREPLLPPSQGLERHALQRAVFEGVLRGEDDALLHARLRARALLPANRIGLRALQDLRDQLEPYARAFARWRDGKMPGSSGWLEVEVGGTVIHGRLDDVYEHGIMRLRLGKRSGPSVIRHGLDWLLASAAGLGLPLVEFHEADDGPGPHPRALLQPGEAKDALRTLLALRLRGLCAPLPFAPYSGWAFFNAGDDGEAALRAAAQCWHGGDYQFGESGHPAIQLAFRGHDPFADDDSSTAFAELSRTIFSALTPAAGNDGDKAKGDGGGAGPDSGPDAGGSPPAKAPSRKRKAAAPDSTPIKSFRVTG